jgi:hypothetical protein
MTSKKYINIFLVLVFSSIILIARDWRVNQIPNATKFSCNTCHTSGGGTPRNDFGKLVEKSFLIDANGQLNANWGPLLASLDADNDGVTNGEELQDPYGQWKEGDPSPGDPNLVTAPGLSSSSTLSTLTINFSGMTPHIGETLYLKVFDRNDMKEVGRTSTTVSETFSLNLDVLISGHSYYIDFFADHNKNGLYDAMPLDHAWRMELANAVGNDVLNFSHNTNFTDIDWSYLLTLNFVGMTPHLGELLEIRVVDDSTSDEIIRKRIESIVSADFSVDLPGIKLNKHYKIDMYADHNKNGLYDGLPTDHAWEMSFTNDTGDFTTTFTHNTNFTDINWKYLLTLNLIGMTPHVNEQLFLRVVDSDNSEEIGRKSVIVPAANFSISIPQIEINHNYNIDFFADHEVNGNYDAPPADHAWRLSFINTTGNFVENFTHNTNFIDIGWADVTSINESNFVNIPEEFSLSQNYPNPFNPTTNIRFSIPEASAVNIKVYDIIGREVATIINNNFAAGVHEVSFNAVNLNSGVYVYRISSKNFSSSKKMILMK